MVTEELYVNGYDGDKVDWTETGVSPYLHDTDADNIRTYVDLAEEGDFTFPASGGSGTINSVKLRFEGRVTAAGCGDVDVYVWNGSAWVGVGSATFGLAYSWIEIDVSAILNTWAKINGVQVRIQYYRNFAGTCYIRRCTRKVDYTLAPKVKAGLHPSKLLAVILDS